MTYNPLGLPEEFYATIRPYVDPSLPIDDRQIADTPSKLITIWKSALAARQAHPNEQELIAEWAMSSGASSPLVNDNDMFEDIHVRFGQLEVPTEDGNRAAWQEVETLVNSIKT